MQKLKDFSLLWKNISAQLKILIKLINSKQKINDESYLKELSAIK